MEANYFTILWWFLPYTDMNQPRVYMCSPSWTLLPPPFASHPSGSSQCTGVESPVSCIELGLVIYFAYGNIHVSVLFSQMIPPSPSPTASKSLFFISVELDMLWMKLRLYIFMCTRLGFETLTGDRFIDFSQLTRQPTVVTVSELIIYELLINKLKTLFWC